MEILGMIKDRKTRRYTAYMPEEELGGLMRRAQEEGVGISALTRLVVGAFVESGLSLKEYRKRMLRYREKGEGKEKINTGG